MKHALTAPSQNALAGSSLGLQEVVRRTMEASSQRAAILAFWDLSIATAAYHYALEEAAFLAAMPLPSASHHQALLSAERAAAKATCSETKLAALRAQQKLADLIGWPDSNNLPLPADQPFVGGYRTYFETLNARGAAPDRLGKIDRILPPLKQVVSDRAESVMATEFSRSELEQAWESGRVETDAVLRIHAGLRQQRRAFLASVRDYNEQIANYALAVAAPGQSEERLAGMLIEQPASTSVPGAERSVLASRASETPIRRVSNEELLEAPRLDPVAPIQLSPSWRRN